MSVDHSRHYFFAGAALASNQHRSVRIRHLLNGVLDFLHLWAGAEKSGEITLLPNAIPQLRRFSRWLLFESSRNPGEKVIELERRTEVVLSPEFRKTEDDFGGSVPGVNDHWRVRP